MFRFLFLLSFLAIFASNPVFSSDFPTTDGMKLMLIEGWDAESNSEPVPQAVEETEQTDEISVEPSSEDSQQTSIQSDQDQDTQSSGQTRLARRMAELKKSAYQLHVAPPSPSADEVPVNQAAEILNQAPRWIVGDMRSPARRARAHIPFCHQPTYYQEINLERCGQLDCERLGCLQNVYSSLWFVGNTAILPYRVGSQPHCTCVGSYGDCRTCHRYDCSIEPLHVGEDCATTSRGLLSQSAAMAGFAFLLL